MNGQKKILAVLIALSLLLIVWYFVRARSDKPKPDDSVLRVYRFSPNGFSFTKISIE